MLTNAGNLRFLHGNDHSYEIVAMTENDKLMLVICKTRQGYDTSSMFEWIVHTPWFPGYLDDPKTNHGPKLAQAYAGLLHLTGEQAAKKMREGLKHPWATEPKIPAST